MFGWPASLCSHCHWFMSSKVIYTHLRVQAGACMLRSGDTGSGTPAHAPMQPRSFDRRRGPASNQLARPKHLSKRRRRVPYTHSQQHLFGPSRPLASHHNSGDHTVSDGAHPSCWPTCSRPYSPLNKTTTKWPESDACMCASTDANTYPHVIPELPTTCFAPGPMIPPPCGRVLPCHLRARGTLLHSSRRPAVFARALEGLPLPAPTGECLFRRAARRPLHWFCSGVAAFGSQPALLTPANQQIRPHLC